MHTLVKFYERTMPEGGRPGHPVVTATLGKRGLIDIHWRPLPGQETPQSGEFWRVQIVRETQIGQNKGAFILHPIEKVTVGSIRKLQPGFYSQIEHAQGNTLVVMPTHGLGDLGPQEVPYIMLLALKNSLFRKKGYSSIVVNLGGEYWGPPDSPAPASRA